MIKCYNGPTFLEIEVPQNRIEVIHKTIKINIKLTKEFLCSKNFFLVIIEFNIFSNSIQKIISGRPSINIRES